MIQLLKLRRAWPRAGVRKWRRQHRIQQPGPEELCLFYGGLATGWEVGQSHQVLISLGPLLKTFRNVLKILVIVSFRKYQLVEESFKIADKCLWSQEPCHHVECSPCLLYMIYMVVLHVAAVFSLFLSSSLYLQFCIVYKGMRELYPFFSRCLCFWLYLWPFCLFVSLHSISSVRGSVADPDPGWTSRTIFPRA